MTKRASGDVAFFLLDGLSLLAYTSQVSDGKESVTEDIAPLGEGGLWPMPIPTGDKKAEFGQSGWFDDAVHGLHEALNGQQGTQRVLLWGFSGNTVGQPFSGAAGVFASKYGRAVSKGSLHKASATYAITGPSEDGVILHALGDETGAGNSEGASSVDANGCLDIPVQAIETSSVASPSVITCARPHGCVTGDKVMIAGHSGSTPDLNGERTVTVISSTQFSVPLNVTVGGTSGTAKRLSTQEGGAGYLACSELVLGGYTDLTVTIRHSQDDVTYVDLVTFDAVTATGGWRKTVTGPVYRHLAAAWSWTGSGAAPRGRFVVGFARG